MSEAPRVLSPLIYSVSYKDMVDIWIETMHPEDNVVVVWDAKNHLETLKNAGFQLDETNMYDNKILTIILSDILDCFYVIDVLKSYKERPYTQIYTGGKLLTDDLDDLVPPLD